MMHNDALDTSLRELSVASHGDTKREEEAWCARAWLLLGLVRRMGVPDTIGRLILRYDEVVQMSLLHATRQSRVLERLAPSFSTSRELSLQSISNVVSVCVSRDATWACYGDADGCAEVVQLHSGCRRLLRVSPRLSAVSCVCHAFDDTLCTGSTDGRVRLWRLIDGALLWQSPGTSSRRPERHASLLDEITCAMGRPNDHPAGVSGVCFASRRIISLDDDGKLLAWLPEAKLAHLPRDRRCRRPLAHFSSLIAADATLFECTGDKCVKLGAVSSDHQTVASALTSKYWVLADISGITRVFALPTLHQIATLKTKGVPARALAASPCGNYVALSRGGSNKRELSVWSVQEATFYLRFQTQLATNSLSLTFLPRSKTSPKPFSSWDELLQAGNLDTSRDPAVPSTPIEHSPFSTPSTSPTRFRSRTGVGAHRAPATQITSRSHPPPR